MRVDADVVMFSGIQISKPRHLLLHIAASIKSCFNNYLQPSEINFWTKGINRSKRITKDRRVSRPGGGNYTLLEGIGLSNQLLILYRLDNGLPQRHHSRHAKEAGLPNWAISTGIKPAELKQCKTLADVDLFTHSRAGRIQSRTP